MSANEHRFRIVVAHSKPDLAGWGAYLSPSVKEGEGKILLNFDAVLWASAEDPSLCWKEVVTETVLHEILHVIEEAIGKAVDEEEVEAAIQRARAYSSTAVDLAKTEEAQS